MKISARPLTIVERVSRVFTYYAKQCKTGAVLITRGKHGDGYYAVDTIEKLCGVALGLLIERWGPNGHWGNIDGMVNNDRDYLNKLERPDTTVEEAMEKLDLPEVSPTIKALRAEWKRYESERRSRQETLDERTIFKETIDHRDSLHALQILFERQDAEYEGVDLETGETVNVEFENA